MSLELQGARFAKYQALGNDYLVLEPASVLDQPLDQVARLLCDRHYGAGADGILLGPYPTDSGAVGLRIFNPDGSEAEKSGNGLRIFARYLYDQGRAGTEPFAIHTAGGTAEAQVDPEDGSVRVSMGRAEFASSRIPVLGEDRLVLNEALLLPDLAVRINAVSLGNPHCVLIVDALSARMAQELGPQIENHSLFPRRTNVQFMRVADRGTIQIEVWERGAGYTLSSGSSACAASAVAYRLGLCDSQVEVRMPGGSVTVALSPDYDLTLTGSVEPVYAGVWLGRS